MLPCPQLSDPVSFSLLFYFIFGEGGGIKGSSFRLSASCGENLLGCFGLCILSTYLSPVPNHPAHRQLLGCVWARPPDQPSGALSGPRACLCPDLILVSHLQSCGPRHPDHPGPEPWPAGQGVESLEDLWVPGPRHHCRLGAGFCGCLSFSVGPRTFAFKRWALQGSARVHLHPLAG